MTEFELLAIPISLVLGLGITQILGEIVAAIRNRDNARLHWLPLAWATWIFLMHVQLFFFLWDQYAEGVVWTWSRFGPNLWHATLLYLAAGLILPGPRDRVRDLDLIDDFQKHGRLALIVFVIYFLDTIPINTLLGSSSWLDRGQVFNLVLGGLIIVSFVNTGRWRAISTALVGVMIVYGLGSIWSVPGVL